MDGCLCCYLRHYDNIYASLWQIAIEIHSEDLLTLPAEKHLSYLQDKYNILRAIEVWTMFLLYLRTSYELYKSLAST